MLFGDSDAMRTIDRTIYQLRTNGTPSTPTASITAPTTYPMS